MICYYTQPRSSKEGSESYRRTPVKGPKTENPRRENVGVPSLWEGPGNSRLEDHRDGNNLCGGKWKRSKAQSGSPDLSVFQQRMREIGRYREKPEAKGTRGGAVLNTAAQGARR